MLTSFAEMQRNRDGIQQAITTITSMAAAANSRVTEKQIDTAVLTDAGRVQCAGLQLLHRHRRTVVHERAYLPKEAAAKTGVAIHRTAVGQAAATHVREPQVNRGHAEPRIDNHWHCCCCCCCCCQRSQHTSKRTHT